MGKPKSLKDKLWGAAVLKTSFVVRGATETSQLMGRISSAARPPGRRLSPAIFWRTMRL